MRRSVPRASSWLKNFRVTLHGDERLADAVDLIVTHNVDRLVRPCRRTAGNLGVIAVFLFVGLHIFYELVIRAVAYLVFWSLKRARLYISSKKQSKLSD